MMTDTLTRRSALAGAAALATGLVGRATAAVSLDAEPPVYGHGLLVQLQVQDLERSVRFYTDVLGFRVTERRDDLQFVHLDCGIERLQLGLSAGAAQPPAPGSVVLNFSVAGDVDRVRAALETRGVVFSGPTRVIPGKVRLAAFTDPDGHRLRLAGDDPPASPGRHSGDVGPTSRDPLRL
jgi:catechol 2,3-dioxygenase-like lactoylglutathione lyase family enzyme